MFPPNHANIRPLCQEPWIHQNSRGIPRAINNLAVQALIAAHANGESIIGESSAQTGVTEVTADRTPVTHL